MEVSDSYHWQREFWQVLQTASTQNIPGFSGALRYQVVCFFSSFFLYSGRIQGKGLSQFIMSDATVVYVP